MINLKPLEHNACDDFEAIAQSKNEPRKSELLSLTDYIEEHFTFYSEKFNSNTLGEVGKTTLGNNDKNNLLHCYNARTLARDRLLSSIRLNQERHILSICQYCGFNTDSTIDHYLPKEDFTEFSVNHLNLLPCCSDCNKFKGTKVLNEDNGYREFINLYTDDLPENQYLFADVNYYEGIPRVGFRLDNSDNLIEQDTFAVILNHYSNLYLLERYKSRFNSVYEEILISARSLRRHSKDVIRSTLIEQAQSLSELHSINFFKVVIYSALANNEDFYNCI